MRRSLAALLLALAGCATSSEQAAFREPAPGVASATLMNRGSALHSASGCRLGATSHICRAWAAEVDGQATPEDARLLRVSAGEHLVRLGCSAWNGGLGLLGAIAPEFTAYSGVFESGRTYYVNCARQEHHARAWIAASVDGPALEGFTAESE
jgi:hypothetical protein